MCEGLLLVWFAFSALDFVVLSSPLTTVLLLVSVSRFSHLSCFSERNFLATALVSGETFLDLPPPLN